MNQQDYVIECYSRTSTKYFEKFKTELESKLFDRIYLKAFADRNRDKGTIADLGCGPGITSNFLIAKGCNMLGIDISPEMVQIAESLNPKGTFYPADMLDLKLPCNSIHGAIALYSIIHFDYNEIAKAFGEIYRVLAPGSEFLVSFHIGDEILSINTFLDTNVQISLHLLNVDKIRLLLEQAGFKLVEIIERYHYAEIEYPSKRAYILSQKN